MASEMETMLQSLTHIKLPHLRKHKTQGCLLLPTEISFRCNLLAVVTFAKSKYFFRSPGKHFRNERVLGLKNRKFLRKDS